MQIVILNMLLNYFEYGLEYLGTLHFKSLRSERFLSFMLTKAAFISSKDNSNIMTDFSSCRMLLQKSFWNASLVLKKQFFEIVLLLSINVICNIINNCNIINAFTVSENVYAFLHFFFQN